MNSRLSRMQSQPSAIAAPRPRWSRASWQLVAGGLWRQVHRQAKPFAVDATHDQTSAIAMFRGSWQRPDSGYVIQINTVDINGVMGPAYFNPNPIHFAKMQQP